jgi:hypothetical protein
MTPFFLAGTAFLRATLPELPHLAGSRTSPVRVPSLITVGCLCFPPGQRAAARSNEPRPIEAAATLLNSFDKCPVLAPGDLHGCQELHDFIASSVRNHDIPNQANDVVGFGNALCQDIAERHGPGKEVSLAQLSQARSSPTNQIVFDPPVSEHFFKPVREVKSQRSGSMFIGLPSKRMAYNLRIPTAPFRSLFP